MKFNYTEDKQIEEIKTYVLNTYQQHYAVSEEIQVVDIWETLGSLESTSRDTAIKYLMRYGKKDGKNKKDLLKAVHYIIYMMYVHDKEKEHETHSRT